MGNTKNNNKMLRWCQLTNRQQTKLMQHSNITDAACESSMKKTALTAEGYYLKGSKGRYQGET